MYSISCNLCSVEGKTAIYWGESHRTWWDRSENHWMALESGDKEYAVVKHMANCHPNTQWNFKFELHGTWKSSLERQVREAMLIDGTPKEHLMNSKSEWGSNSIPRVTTGQDKDRDRDNGDGDAGGKKRILKKSRQNLGTEQTGKEEEDWNHREQQQLLVS